MQALTAVGDYKLVSEDQIVNYLRPKQLANGRIQVVLNSGRVFTMASFAELAQISPGGWFKGIIRVDGGRSYLWGVLLCVACSQFTHKRDSLRGFTNLQRDLLYDRYFDRTSRESNRKKAGQIRIARANDDLRRIRELYAYGFHTEADWLSLVEACGSCCLRCGAPNTTKDHIIPLSTGGTDLLSNLQPLCRPCNSWKGAKIIDFRDYSRPKVAYLLRLYELPCGSSGREGRQGNDDAGPGGASDPNRG